MEKKQTKRTSKNPITAKDAVLEFRRQFDPKYKGCQGEINDEVSQTVPDMAITVHEMLLNHTRGIPNDVSQLDGQYFDQEIPQIDDFTDLEIFKEQLIERLEETTAIIKAENEEKKKKDAEVLKKEETPGNRSGNAREDIPGTQTQNQDSIPKVSSQGKSETK